MESLETLLKQVKEKHAQGYYSTEGPTTNNDIVPSDNTDDRPLEEMLAELRDKVQSRKYREGIHPMGTMSEMGKATIQGTIGDPLRAVKAGLETVKSEELSLGEASLEDRDLSMEGTGYLSGTEIAERANMVNRGMKPQDAFEGLPGSIDKSKAPIAPLSPEAYAEDEPDGYENLSPERKQVYKDQAELMHSFAPKVQSVIDSLPDVDPSKSTGKWHDALVGISRYLPQMGITAVNPMAGTALLYTGMVGAKHDELTQQGVNPDRAFKAALISSVPQVGIEQAGNLVQIGLLKPLLGPIARKLGVKTVGDGFEKYFNTIIKTRLGKTGAAMGGGALGEYGEEYAQQWVDVAANVWAANPDLTTDEKIQKYKELASHTHQEAKVSGGIGARGGLLLGAAGGGISWAANKAFNLDDYKSDKQKDIDESNTTNKTALNDNAVEIDGETVKAPKIVEGKIDGKEDLADITNIRNAETKKESEKEEITEDAKDFNIGIYKSDADSQRKYTKKTLLLKEALDLQREIRFQEAKEKELSKAQAIQQEQARQEQEKLAGLEAQARKDYANFIDILNYNEADETASESAPGDTPWYKPTGLLRLLKRQVTLSNASKNKDRAKVYKEVHRLLSKESYDIDKGIFVNSIPYGVDFLNTIEALTELRNQLSGFENRDMNMYERALVNRATQVLEDHIHRLGRVAQIEKGRIEGKKDTQGNIHKGKERNAPRAQKEKDLQSYNKSIGETRPKEYGVKDPLEQKAKVDKELAEREERHNKGKETNPAVIADTAEKGFKERGVKPVDMGIEKAPVIDAKEYKIETKPTTKKDSNAIKKEISDVKKDISRRIKALGKLLKSSGQTKSNINKILLDALSPDINIHKHMGQSSKDNVLTNPELQELEKIQGLSKHIDDLKALLSSKEKQSLVEQDTVSPYKEGYNKSLKAKGQQTFPAPNTAKTVQAKKVESISSPTTIEDIRAKENAEAKAEKAKQERPHKRKSNTPPPSKKSTQAKPIEKEPGIKTNESDFIASEKKQQGEIEKARKKAQAQEKETTRTKQKRNKLDLKIRLAIHARGTVIKGETLIGNSNKMGYSKKSNAQRAAKSLFGDMGNFEIIEKSTGWYLKPAESLHKETANEFVSRIKKGIQSDVNFWNKLSKEDKARYKQLKNLGAKFSRKPDAPATVWYSQMQNFLSDKLGKKEPVKQLIAKLKSWSKKSNTFKEEELEWSGLTEWLAEQEGKVSKDDLLNWLAENNVKIEEVELGKTDTEYEHHSFNTPGGKDYRELLITINSPKISAHSQKVFHTSDYKAPQPILLHVRFKTKTDTKGKKTLFIEEIQSDWAQKGRKYGYKGDYKAFEKELLDAARAKNISVSETQKAIDFLKIDPMDTEARPTGWAWKQISIVISDTNIGAYKFHEIFDYGISNRPFKTTSQWVTLGMKRIVRYAAENGFDQIAWTPGFVQNDRYDLSKQVESVSVEMVKFMGRPAYDLHVLAKDGSTFTPMNLNADELVGHVGKDMADKIIDDSRLDKIGDIATYENLDLKVGGEKMESFYDSIIPKTLNKFFGKKKWGKAKVNSISLGKGVLGEVSTQIYEGPILTRKEVQTARRKYLKDNAAEFKNIDHVGVNHRLMKNQMTTIITQMDNGMAFKEVIERYASPMVAKYLGGKVTITDADSLVLSLPITPQMKEKALGEGFPMFSKKESREEQGKGQKAKELITALTKLTTKTKGFIDTKVIQSKKDLPNYLLETEDITDTVEGLFDTTTNTVYLIADNLYSPTHAIQKWVHEAVGHKGLKSFITSIDGNYSDFINQVHRLIKNEKAFKELSKLYEQDTKGLSENQSIELFVEEFLARRLERVDPFKKKRITKVIKDFINNLLTKIGIKKNQITLVDVDNILEAATQYTLNNKTPVDTKTGFETGPQIKLSRKSTPHLDEIRSIFSLTNKSVWDRVKEFKDTLKNDYKKGIFDNLRPLFDLEKEYAPNIPAELSGFKGAHLHRNLPNIMGAIFNHGKPEYRNHHIIVDVNKPDNQDGGFLDIFSKLGDNAEDFMWWFTAKSAEEIIKTRPGSVSEKLFGVSPATGILYDPQEVINKIYEKTLPAYTHNKDSWNEAVKQLSAFNKAILDFCEKAHILTPETREIWEREFYVGFNRIAENVPGRENSTRFKHTNSKKIGGIKHMRGSDKLVGHPLNNIMQNYTNLINEALKNMARMKVYRVLNSAGLVFKATNIPSEIRVQGSAISGALNKITGEKGKKRLTKEQAKQYTDIIQMVSPIEKDGVFMIRVDGKPQYFQTEDVDIFEALVDMDLPQTLGPLGAFLQWSKRVRTLGITLRPSFMLRNPLRDQLSTAVVESDFKPFVNLAKQAKDVWSRHPDIIALQSMGGSFTGGYFRSDNPEAMDKWLDTEKDKHNPKNVLVKLYEKYTKLGEATENATRLELYRNIKKLEGSIEAAYRSKDILDFNKHGSWPLVRTAIRYIPFLNARLQGEYRLGGAAFGKRTAKAFFKRGAVLSGLMLGLWLWNKDDDRWRKMENHERWNYIHFLGPKGIHIRFPIPFEVGILFCSSVAAIADSVTDKSKGGIKHLVDFIMHSAKDTLQLNPLEPIQPILTQVHNKDPYTDRKVLNSTLEKLSPKNQKEPWTSKSLQIVGDITDFEFWGKKWGVSPKRAEKFLSDEFGMMAEFPLMILDYVVAPHLKSFPEDPALTNEDYFIWGDFIRNTVPRNTRYISEMYSMLSEYGKVVGDFNQYKKWQMGKEARALLKNSRPKLIAHRQLSAAQKKLSSFNNQMKINWMNRNISRKIKRERNIKILKKRNDFIEKQVLQVKKRLK